MMIILTRKAVEESPHEWTHPRVEPSCLFSLFCQQMGGMGGFLMAYGTGGSLIYKMMTWRWPIIINMISEQLPEPAQRNSASYISIMLL